MTTNIKTTKTNSNNDDYIKNNPLNPLDHRIADDSIGPDGTQFVQLPLSDHPSATSAIESASVDEEGKKISLKKKEILFEDEMDQMIELGEPKCADNAANIVSTSSHVILDDGSIRKGPQLDKQQLASEFCMTSDDPSSKIAQFSEIMNTNHTHDTISKCNSFEREEEAKVEKDVGQMPKQSNHEKNEHLPHETEVTKTTRFSEILDRRTEDCGSIDLATQSAKMSLGSPEEQKHRCLRSERSNSCSSYGAAALAAAQSSSWSGRGPGGGNEAISDGSSLDQARSISSTDVTMPADGNADAPDNVVEGINGNLPSNTSIDLASSTKQNGNSTQILRQESVKDNNTFNRQQAQQQQSGGSRFFSSKLNTGSLWSLLSGGGGAAGEQISTSKQQPIIVADEQSETHESSNPNCSNSQFTSLNLRNSASIFERAVQFGKRGQQQTDWKIPETIEQQQQKIKATSINSKQMGNSHSMSLSKENIAQASSKVKYRFTLKYVGSSLLHKNFTLSMLEWVAKDIRRHTLKAAGLGRQFAFRDIYFEIYINKFVALNCKDYSCIFVHPMQNVTKYVQLQLDQNCFSYILRDTRELVQFVHVFQAKNATKVHEIFNALREITARASLSANIASSSSSSPITMPNPSINQKQQQQNRVAATPNHSLDNKSIRLSSNLDNQNSGQQNTKHSDSSQTTNQPASQPGNSTNTNNSFNSTNNNNNNNNHHHHNHNSNDNSGNNIECGINTSNDNAMMMTKSERNVMMESQRQPINEKNGSTSNTLINPNIVPAAGRGTASINIDNSYQFEVMFVKRVKLNCRRVPASFVDDALETLKSFEVLKINDSKAIGQLKMGKSRANIIKGKVDEQQEYDELANTNDTGSTSDNTNNNSLQITQSKMNATSTSRPVAPNSGSSSSSSSCDDSNCRRSSLTITANSNKGQQDHDQTVTTRSCQHTPTKQQQEKQSQLESCNQSNRSDNSDSGGSQLQREIDILKKHSSMESLNVTHDTSTRYSNDFSPYNTITSSGLNERIAAIPVVSHGSVSLDHETRQRLARQVRQTIQATAANIKKDVYESGNEISSQLKSSLSLKAINSLSCTVASEVPSIGKRAAEHDEQQQIAASSDQQSDSDQDGQRDLRRQSSSALPMTMSSSNNFDLFRRASARQVVKNRTMLLLIGKEELCTISIDKHQMLFSKSFSQIMHCLQGHNNRDHFGLICRDSNKIQPTAESYTGFVFKCQSEKVVREIMAALKQVIYNSQHNYDGYYSPYNPIHQSLTKSTNMSDHKHGLMKKLSTDLDSEQHQRQQHLSSLKNDDENLHRANNNQATTSLANKRGFTKPLDLDGAAKLSSSPTEPSRMVATAPVESSGDHSPLGAQHKQQAGVPTSAKLNQPKLNLIRTMFCDNCPLYWFHRLCCDIESLPMEASKAIILRRIDSSLSEREQDDLLTKFSEHQIDSIEEHNVIFMSLLRHLCESKQTKHSQTSSHLSAVAKNVALLKQQHNQATSFSAEKQSAIRGGQAEQEAKQVGTCESQTIMQQQQKVARFQHTRSGSTGGAFVGASEMLANASDAAGAAAIDNLKRAKNTISISIENMLKRRSSNPRESDLTQIDCDDSNDDYRTHHAHLPMRSGSLRNPPKRQQEGKLASRDARTDDEESIMNNNNSKQQQLKRSESTSDYVTAATSSLGHQIINPSIGQASSWRDSFSRTIQDSQDSLASPFVDFFRRKSNTQTRSLLVSGQDSSRSSNGTLNRHHNSSLNPSSSTECLSISSTGSNEISRSSKTNCDMSAKHCNTPNLTSSNEAFQQQPSMLSSVFWKKSLFDKIRQPTGDGSHHRPRSEHQSVSGNAGRVRRRTSQELRNLWRKAVLEQITLIKMDKQNQSLASGLSKKLEKTTNTNSSHEPERPRSSSLGLTTSQMNDDLASLEPADPVKMKLNYTEMAYQLGALSIWDQFLKQDPQRKVEFVEVARLVRLGVPKRSRGEIWMFLMNQYQLRHGTSYQPADEFQGDANQPYRGLLTQLSVQQHEIFVDIGRTFPTHPYYSQYLSIGQLSLFNLLKAYSLLDPEVGYCQGLSFVAGILLLHVDTEDEAFELMRHLLFNFGLRRQYFPSMDALHLQLYQITRLLRDHEYDLFNHFDRYDISPTLYAAPWFLTLFASQFSLGFVARLFDLILLIGIEAIFRISLNLLAHHKDTILACNGIESTMEFLKHELVRINDRDLVGIFDKSFSMDLRNELLEYEIEYRFYCAEDHRSYKITGNSTNNLSDKSSKNKRVPNSAKNQETIDMGGSNRLASTTYGFANNQQDHLDILSETAHKIDHLDAISQISQSHTDKSQKEPVESTSMVADATATLIIQHLLAKNHLKSLKTNYTY